MFIQVFDTGLRKRQNQNVPSTSPTAKPLTALSSLAKLYESVCIACSTILLSWFAPMVIGCLQGQAPRMADIKFLDSVCSTRTCFEYFSLHRRKEQTTESTASTASSMGGSTSSCQPRPDPAQSLKLTAGPRPCDADASIVERSRKSRLAATSTPPTSSTYFFQAILKGNFDI